MARAYSLDLRERVVAAVAAGESCRAVATKFKVSVASVVKCSQRFRATGSAAASRTARVLCSLNAVCTLRACALSARIGSPGW